MHKSLRIFLVLLLLSFCGATFAQQEDSPQVLIQSLTKLFPGTLSAFDELRAGDLVVLDLDNTVFREVQTLGTDEWYSHAIAKMTALGKSHRQAANELEETNAAIKDISGMRLMEEAWPRAIHVLQQRGVWVMGLTARHPNLAKSTVRNLRALKIDFDHLPFSASELAEFHVPGLANDFFWTGGVAFTDGSPKGLVLRGILAKTGIRPRQVIAIDDRIHHVHTLTEALLEMKIAGRVIQYLRAQEEIFDPAVADFELEWFKRTGELLDDETARAFLDCEDKLTVRSLSLGGRLL